MDPSAFHQPAAIVPAGQALTPLLMVQQGSAYPSEQHSALQGQSRPRQPQMASYGVSDRVMNFTGATASAVPTNALPPRKSRRVDRRDNSDVALPTSHWLMGLLRRPTVLAVG